MLMLFIIIWLLLGVITVWRTYWGYIKKWYMKFNCDLRKDYKFNSHLKLLICGSPILIIGGISSLIMSEILNPYNTWYFKIPK